MITRWLPLYLRSRRVTIAVPISLAAIAAVTLLWSAWSKDPRVHPGLAALTVLFAVVPGIPTLASDDDALEKTAAMPWPPRRALHLTILAAGTTIALLSAELANVHFGATGQLARNCAGLAGLIGLGVALLGTALASITPIVWVAVQAMASATGGKTWQQSVFWLTQPADSRPAAVTAGVLFLAGTIAYAIRVSPPKPPSEATMGQ